MSAYEEQGEIAHLIGLAPVFTPAQAAGVLRSIGLDDITECALRTRAYRKQIPFHLNGHRIIFTVEDLREIAEGRECRPSAAEREAQAPRHPARSAGREARAAERQAQAAVRAPGAVPARTARRAAPRVRGQVPADAWRARRPRHG